MEINKTIPANDKIAVTGAIVFGGTLNLTITGTLKAGDQYTLFTGSSYSGNFSKIIPETPGSGLNWDFTNGVLKVINGTNRLSNFEDAGIKIYPNPVLNQAEISINNNYNHLLVSVFDMNGKTLFQHKSTNNQHFMLDLSLLSKGIYSMKIQDEKKLNVVSRFVKM